MTYNAHRVSGGWDVTGIPGTFADLAVLADWARDRRSTVVVIGATSHLTGTCHGPLLFR